MLRLLLAAAVATAAVSPALARDDADLNSQLRAMPKWSNEEWHLAAYEKILADQTLTDEQRARVLNYRAVSRGAAGDKLGQLADLDLVVAKFPNVTRAQAYKEARAYAYVQAWHMANRVLESLTMGRKSSGAELRDLWGLGFWDDVEARALENGEITISSKYWSRDIARKLAETGRGTAQMCVAVMENKAPCEMGADEPSPQPLQGDALVATLTELKERAAVYKTD